MIDRVEKLSLAKKSAAGSTMAGVAAGALLSIGLSCANPVANDKEAANAAAYNAPIVRFIYPAPPAKYPAGTVAKLGPSANFASGELQNSRQAGNLIAG